MIIRSVYHVFFASRSATSASLVLLLFVTAGCNQNAFEAKKSEFLKQSSVFGCSDGTDSTGCDSAHGSLQTDGGGKSADGNIVGIPQGGGTASVETAGPGSSSVVTTGGSGATTGSSSVTTGGSSSGANGSVATTSGNSISSSTGSLPTQQATPAPMSTSIPTSTPISSSVSTPAVIPVATVDCSNVTQRTLQHGGSYPAECNFDRPQTSIPFHFFCSTSMITGTFAGGQPNLASTGGVSLYNSNSLSATFVDFAGNTVCTINDADLKNKLMSTKRLDLAGKCPQIAAGTYRLRLIANGSRKISFNSVDSMTMHAYSGVQDDVIVTLARDSNGALIASNPGCVDATTGRPKGCGIFSANTQYNEAGVLYESNPEWSLGEPGGERCDQLNSPLVIQLPDPGQAPAPLDLSSPLDGVWFDILGKNSLPAPHTKKQISWLTPRARLTNYFLTLPDANGEVRGIDQLFGDNTFGPDGRFSANGYEALRKYDLNGDGVIDRRDPVFPALRLWADLDGNGVADRTELSTLASRRVEMIDLNYDASYFESDRFGNQIRYKSVVKTTDGELHLIFDIWFRIY